MSSEDFRRLRTGHASCGRLSRVRVWALFTVPIVAVTACISITKNAKSYAIKFAQADAARRRLVAQLPWDLDAPGGSAGCTTTVARAAPGPQRPRTTGKPKLGRNAPCWCGSGKKYKKCHLPLEEHA